MTISAGTYIIKADATEDYISITAAKNDIVGTGQTGNLKFIVDGAIDDWFVINHKLNGYEFAIEGLTANGGNPNAGSVVNVTGGATVRISTDGTSDGSFVLKNMRFVDKDGGATFSFELRTSARVIDITASGNLFDGLDVDIVSGTGGHATGTHIFKANKIFDGQLNVAGGSYIVGEKWLVENNTIDGQDTIAEPLHCASGIEIICRNNYVIRSSVATTDIDLDTPSSVEGYNSFTEDTSATAEPWLAASGNAGNKDPATRVQSLIDTDDDYLFPVEDADLINGGAITSSTIEDIAGNPIPNNAGQYPVGCHALPDTFLQELIPVQKYKYAEFINMLKRLFPRGAIWNFRKPETDYGS